MDNKIVRGHTRARLTLQKKINAVNGEIMKYLPIKPENGEIFSEVYFSKILPNSSKKWKFNVRQSQNISVILGKAAVICIENFEDIYYYEEFLLDDQNNFAVLEIPAGIYYGMFTDENGAMIANALKLEYQSKDNLEVAQNFPLEPTVL